MNIVNNLTINTNDKKKQNTDNKMKLNDGIVTWPIISMEPRVLHTE